MEIQRRRYYLSVCLLGLTIGTVYWLVLSILSLSATHGQLPNRTNYQLNRASPTENAYATLLYGNFLLGTQVLGQSLKESGTANDMIVLCTKDVPESSKVILKNEGWIVKDVEEINNPYGGGKLRNPHAGDRIDHFRKVMTKIEAWRLTEYRRVLLIDSDIVVVRNIDYVFNCGEFCVVTRHSDQINSGVIVLKPSIKVYNDMIDKLNRLEALPEYSNYPTNHDQGFLVVYFHKVLAEAKLFNSTDPHQHEQGMRLPTGYNSDSSYYYVNSRWYFPEKDIKAIHYALGDIKPWMWWSYPLFEVNWVWYSYRLRLSTDDPSRAVPLCLHLLPTIFLMVILLLVSRYRPHASNSSKLTILASKVDLVNGRVVGIYTVASLTVSYYLSYLVIPTCTIPHIADLIFCQWTLLFLIIFYCAYYYMLLLISSHAQDNIAVLVMDIRLEIILWSTFFVVYYTFAVVALYAIELFSTRVKAFFSLVGIGYIFNYYIGKRVIRILAQSSKKISLPS